MLGLTRSEQLEEFEDSSIGEIEREKLSVSYVLNCVARGTAALTRVAAGSEGAGGEG